MSCQERGLHHDEVVELLVELRTAQSILLKQVEALSGTVQTLLTAVQSFDRWVAVHDEYTKSKLAQFDDLRTDVDRLRADMDEVMGWHKAAVATKRAHAWMWRAWWIILAATTAAIGEWVIRLRTK